MNPNNKHTILILGQGLAGSILAWKLIKLGFNIVVIDNNHKSSASKVAAGILNPITGRRLSLHPDITSLLPAAIAFYREIENSLHIQCIQQKDMLRIIDSQETLDLFKRRALEPVYQDYLGSYNAPNSFVNSIHDPFGSFIIKQSAYLDTQTFLRAIRKFLEERKCLIEMDFDYSELKLLTNGIKYKNIKAELMIFCEGYKALKNPWFQHLQFQYAKGEILTINLDNHLPDYIINQRKWLLPQGDHKFKAGSNYDCNTLDETPTLAAKNEIISELSKSIKNFMPEIIEHKGGIRLNTTVYKPVAERHPQYLQLAIFNAFASKGSFLIPSHADSLIKLLCN